MLTLRPAMNPTMSCGCDWGCGFFAECKECTVGLEFVDEIHTVRARPASRRQFCRGSRAARPLLLASTMLVSILFVAALWCWYSG